MGFKTSVIVARETSELLSNRKAVGMSKFLTLFLVLFFALAASAPMEPSDSKIVSCAADAIDTTTHHPV